jgi:hypothetical protein
MKTQGYLDMARGITRSGIEEVVKLQYEQRFKMTPVDRLLCRPHDAICFAAIVRDRMYLTIAELPDNVILETLINLRKRGNIKTGEVKS